MLKHISILLVLLVTITGTLFGLVSPASASKSLPAYGPPVAVARPVEVYLVRNGDSLSVIAKKFHLKDWRKLYCENRKVIGNKPWLIQPKMRLRIKKSRKLCNVPVAVVKAPQVQTSKRQVTLDTTGTFLGSGSFQSCVISRESGGDPTAYNSSSGASGLYGMLLSTWDSLGVGYPGGASTAPVSVQNRAFEILYARSGTAPWAPYDGC